ARRLEVTEVGIPDAVAGQLAGLAHVPRPRRAAKRDRPALFSADLEARARLIGTACVLSPHRISEDRNLSRPRQPAELVDRDLGRYGIDSKARAEGKREEEARDQAGWHQMVSIKQV